jgi:transposase
LDVRELYTRMLNIKLPWYIDRVIVDEGRQRIDVYIVHEPDIRARCPECQEFFSVYDHGPEREYRHLDTCEMQTYIHVNLPRVQCPLHGVRQIVSEFGEQPGMTFSFEQRMLDIAQHCDIKATSEMCRVSWDICWNTVERAVERGFARKNKTIPERIGIDEKSVGKGHRYETLVYDLDRGTVEFVCEDRSQESLEQYFRQFTPEELKTVRVVTMDMWEPYIAATRNCIPDADRKIVFDRFHVMRYVVDAVDSVRKGENRTLIKQGEEILKGTRYLWLWNKENIPEYRQEEFAELRKSNLKVGRAWALKEQLREMWDYRYTECMRKFFNRWYRWAIRSRLGPMMKAARTLHRHIDNIVTYARHRITNAMGESINSRIEKVKRMACGSVSYFQMLCMK